MIHRAIEPLGRTLPVESLTFAALWLMFLRHLRSLLVAVLMVLVAASIWFIPMHLLSVRTDLSSLGGTATAIGAMVDAAERANAMLGACAAPALDPDQSKAA